MATTSEASRLQRGVSAMRFMWITVGLLAMTAFSACGVGVDDVDGQQAAYGSTATTQQTEQALATGPEGCPPPTGEETAPSTGGVVDPGIANLPTDPVPWHAPNPVNGVDPVGNPMGEDVPLPGPGGMPVRQ